MRVDAKALEALKRLGQSPDGRVLQSLLAAEYESQIKALVSAPVENVQRAQGRAALLNELIDLLAKPGA
jgi:hypothetical protein